MEKTINYEMYLVYSDLFTNVNEKVSLLLKMYVLNYIEEQKIKNDINNLRKKLNLKINKASDIMSLKEYKEFLSIIYENVNKEKNYSKDTYKMFKILVDLIYLISIWKPLETELLWVKLLKSCKLKIVKIYKILNRIDKDNSEFEDLVKEVEQEKISEDKNEILENSNMTNNNYFDKNNIINSIIVDQKDNPELLKKSTININKENSLRNSPNSIETNINSESLKNSNIYSNSNIYNNPYPVKEICNKINEINNSSNVNTVITEKNKANFSEKNKDNYSNCTFNQNPKYQLQRGDYNIKHNILNAINQTNLKSNHFININVNDNPNINNNYQSGRSDNNQPKPNPFLKYSEDDMKYKNLIKAINDVKYNKHPEPKSLSTNQTVPVDSSENNIKPIKYTNDPVFNQNETTRSRNNSIEFKKLTSALNNQSFQEKDFPFNLPIKYRSPDYYKLIMHLKKKLKEADSHIEKNNINNALHATESILFLLAKIE